MSLHWYSVVVDAHDIHSLARWWAETLDFMVIYESADEAVSYTHLTLPTSDLV